MSNVTALRPSEWTNDKGEQVTTYYVSLEGREKDVPCYDATAKDLAIGQPLPEGWEVKVSQKGKDYLATPKKGGGKEWGGKSSWYNSEEGVRFTQERTDRRTALMQMVAAAGLLGQVTEADLKMADWFYAWLRKSAGSAPSSAPPNTGSAVPPFRSEPGSSPALPGGAGDTGEAGSRLVGTPVASPKPSAAEPGRAADTGGAADKGTGEGPASAAPTCPACNSPNIGRKGRTWKCGDCQQDWEA